MTHLRIQDTGYGKGNVFFHVVLGLDLVAVIDYTISSDPHVRFFSSPVLANNDNLMVRKAIDDFVAIRKIARRLLA